MDAADEIFRDASRQVEAVMQEAVNDVRQDLYKSISIPVERRSGKVIRSKPGEFPRMDTRRLRGSVTGVVYRTGSFTVNGVVATDTPYDEILVRTRPYDKLIVSKWARLIEQRFAYAMK